MSRASRLGYAGERPVELLMQQEGFPAARPRAGAVADVGDLTGLPLVVSCKNHATLALASWVDDLPRMIAAAGVETGVVWHKRRGRSNPTGWYVTTTGDLFLPLLRAYALIPPDASGGPPRHDAL